MFKTKKQPVKPQDTSINSFLGDDIKIEGMLTTNKNLRLDGEIVGDIKVSDTLVIGQVGVVKGDINVGEIEIYGRVIGNIYATKFIKIYNSGTIDGDIETPSLNIEEGGRLNGKSTMTAKEEPKTIDIAKTNNTRGERNDRRRK